MSVCQLRPYETLNIFKPVVRAAGSHIQTLLIQGNSILSTLVIDSLTSGSVLVEFEEIVYEDQLKPLFSRSFSSVGTFEFWTHPYHNSIKVTLTTTDSSKFTIKSTARTDVELLRSSSIDGEDYIAGDNKHIPIGCLDPETQKLFYLHCRVEGQIAAGIAGLIGFAFKDSDGKVVLPQLTTDGKIPVSGDSAGIHSEAHNTNSTGGGGRKLVCTAPLNFEKKYSLKFLSTSSTQEVLWEVEQTDDATDSIRHAYVSGGNAPYTNQINAGCLEFIAGDTGTQSVKIYGTQLKGPPSDMIGTLCLLQIGA